MAVGAARTNTQARTGGRDLQAEPGEFEPGNDADHFHSDAIAVSKMNGGNAGTDMVLKKNNNNSIGCFKF